MRKIFLLALCVATILYFNGFIRTARADSAIIVVGKGGEYVFSINGESYFPADESKLDTFVQNVSKKERRQSSDAHYEYDKLTKKFTVVAEEYGYELKSDSLKENIKAAISVGGKSVCCEYDYIKPEIFVKDLKGTLYKRAIFSSVHQLNENRDHNISLATQAIDGYRLKKGEIFSFNEVVGARDSSRGYKESKIIVGGNFVEGVGGGVCQVSTTLYNAALLSGLEIVECHRHTLRVNYVEPSFDAMVSGNSCDLKFKNITDGDIFIVASDIDNVLTFEIFGKKQTKSYRRESVVENELLPELKIIKTDKLKTGEVNVVSESKVGCVSKGYLLTYLDGELILKQLIRQDNYAKVDKIVEIGR